MADGFEQFYFFVADGLGFERHGRFHRDERKHLQHVILHHVADRAGFLVITAAVADTEFFADGDLDVINGFAVPKRSKMELEKRNIKMFCTVSLPR